MMPGFLLGSSLVIAVILESAVFPRFAFPGVRIDLVLVLVVLNGLDRGRLSGALWGVAGGLLEDVLVGRAIGISALGRMTAGYLAGSIQETLFKDNITTPGLCVFLGGVIYAMAVFALGSSVGIIRGGALTFIRAQAYSLCLNVVLAPIVYSSPIFSGARGVEHVRKGT